MPDYTLLRTIFDLSRQYLDNNGNGTKTDDINYKIINGKIPIILSAPHAVKSYKSGKEKKADLVTGAIVQYLCKMTGAYGIIRTYNLKDDPNSQNTENGLKYKEGILKLIRENKIECMMDIHGFSKECGSDIDIGINNGLNINGREDLLQTIREELAGLGNITVDKKYKASFSTNVSRYISEKEKNVACFQLEISNKIRNSIEKLPQLLDSMERAIEKVAIQIESEKPKEKIDEER